LNLRPDFVFLDEYYEHDVWAGCHAYQVTNVNRLILTREQFKGCFDLWFDELRNYISYRCCDTDLATDIVQETFVKVWEKQLEFEGNKTKALLYKIAKDLWISHYRKTQSEGKYRLNFSFKLESNDTEEQLNYQELKDNYEKALAVMPEKRRVVFLMSRMESLTYQEISERLEVSVKAVEKRMNLAIQELRNILGHGK
jgi:RNA polymerase sigma-70 factor (family 1)